MLPIDDWLSDNDQIAPSQALGLQPFLPAIVGKLQEDGPALKYGIKEGDLIQAINGKDVTTWQELSRNLSLLPNQLIEIKVLRGQESKILMLESSSFIDETGVQKGRIGILASNNFNNRPADFVVENPITRPIHTFLINRLYMSKFFNWFGMRTLDTFAMACDWFDLNVIDGVVNGIANLSQSFSSRVRKVNSGFTGHYASLTVGGLGAIVLLTRIIMPVMGWSL